MAMTPARNAIDVGLLVGDIAASLAFYEGVLGLRKVQQMPTTFGTMHRMAFGEWPALSDFPGDQHRRGVRGLPPSRLTLRCRED